MSRPKKKKPRVEAMPPDQDSAGSLFQDSIRRRALPDECDEFMLGSLADLIVADDPTKEGIAQEGGWLVRLIRNLEVEDCERMFRAIIAIKRNLDLPPSRESHALRACADFIKEAGRPPSKSELRKFIVARPEKYRYAPGEDDKKGWTRLWQATHLDGLAPR